MKKILVEKFGQHNIELKIAAAAIKSSGKLEGFSIQLEDGFSCSISSIEQVWNSKDLDLNLVGGHSVNKAKEEGEADISSKGSGESKLVIKGLKMGQGAIRVEIGELEFDSLSEAVDFALQFSEETKGDYEVFKDK